MKKWLKIFFASDKTLYLLIGAIIAFIFGAWLSPLWGLLAAITFAVGKTVWDKFGFGTSHSTGFSKENAGALLVLLILMGVME